MCIATFVGEAKGHMSETESKTEMLFCPSLLGLRWQVRSGPSSSMGKGGSGEVWKIRLKCGLPLDLRGEGSLFKAGPGEVIFYENRSDPS